MRQYIIPAISLSLLMSCNKGYDHLKTAGEKFNKTISFGKLIPGNLKSKENYVCPEQKYEDKEAVSPKYKWDPKLLFW